MQNDFYKSPRRGYIYLLLLDLNEEEHYYYVGKSFSNSISKVYSRHLHAGFVTTKNIFSCDAQPKLYILQDSLLTGAEAYRFVVAYTRFFQEQQLGECLNHDGTMRQAELLKLETQKIYLEISQEPIAELLHRTYVARAIDADHKRIEAVELGTKQIVQFNISISEDDKASFDTYCKRHGISRREAFGILLDDVINKTSSHYERIINKKEKIIEKTVQQNKKLEQKLALATGQSLPKRELWTSMMYPFMLEGVKQYLQLLLPQRSVTQPVRSRPYKGFSRGLHAHEEYVYPEKDGFYLVRLEAILWGNHKSCFYAGTTSDGNHFKFRYYFKEWFIGTPPRGSGYEEQDSLWLVGCKKAADGAMDLVAAFPIPNAKINNAVKQKNEDIRPIKPQKPSLAGRLANIESRKT